MAFRWFWLVIGSAVLAGGPAAAATLNIPLRTWVAVPSPTVVNGTPTGACNDGACKHTRITFNPGNNRTYWLGGDFYPHSGTNYMFSYSAADNTWRMETPYCVPPGQIQPNGPDEIGFAYDTRRNVFWMTPGYQWDNSSECANLVKGKSMIFDPSTQTWSLANKPNWDAVYPGLQVFSQYDPVTDSNIMFNSTTVYLYHMDGTAERIVPSRDSNGVDVSNAQLWDEYTAFDPVRRVIYAIDPVQAKIYGFFIDNRELRYLAPAPAGTLYDQSMPMWDSINRVVLWPQVFPLDGSGNAVPIRFHVYHPDTNTWEANLPVNNPVDLAGNVVRDPLGNPIPVIGRIGVFDPSQNVLIFTGVNAANPVPYIFLYRYGNGSGTPTDSLPPSPPTNLRPR